MRILFLTQDDPLYIQPFFERFFEQVDPSIAIAGVWACRSMGSRKRLRLAGELLRLYQVTGFAKLLAIQAAARLRARLPRQHTASIAGLCALHQVPYRRIGNPNTAEIVEDLRQHEPDVLVSIACPYILRRKILDIPRLDAINLHQAPLPRYRGMMPTFWQMYHGEPSVGVTVHRISELLDEGPALYQGSLPIHPGDSMHQLIRRSKRHGADAVCRVLLEIANGEARALPASTQQPTSFTFPTAAEMAEFHRRRLRTI